MSSIAPSDDADLRRNKRVAIICAAVFFGMLGMAFAAVPLYRAFCQLTGFDGTVRKAEAAPDRVLNKTLKIRFDANVRDLPWTFTAMEPSQSIRIGDTGLTHFKVTNHSNRPITGRAVYNVVPEQAGQYFQKLECFCFSDQTIQPGQTVEFPVVYFVDPKFAEDFETKGQGEVTLSYTYYPSTTPKSAPAPQAAVSQALGGTVRAGL